MTFTIRPVVETDRNAWGSLYRGYRDFYKLEDDPEVLDRAWQWLMTGEHTLFGLVAAQEDELLGLAHLKWMARPSTGTICLYLDDLFTAPVARGQGVGHALLVRASQIAAERGASVVRWITDVDNTTARRVYDEVATATRWVTYDMAPKRG
ncbi:MAG TPA: GNAT family N-acetyltransferase [Marmoricola sp.]|nr:GNAT family N-acetyltransferase [Marmoricola sp.]